MIVGLFAPPANEPLSVSDLVTVGSFDAGTVELLVAVVLGGVAGVWLFLKILALIRKLLVALAVGAVLVLLHEHGLPDLFEQLGEAGATQPAPSVIPPMGDFLPPR